MSVKPRIVIAAACLVAVGALVALVKSAVDHVREAGARTSSV